MDDEVNKLMQEVEDGREEGKEASSTDAARVFTQWRLLASRQLLERSQQANLKLAGELEHAKSQVSRQHKDFSSQMQQLTLKRNHGLDVTDLAQQVRDLVKEIERLKSNQLPVVETPAALIPQATGKMLGGMWRDHHLKLCRLEEEISNEKLKRAMETARRVEKESECNQCRRQMEDMQSEIVSLQLKLARMEMGGEVLPRPSNAPKYPKISLASAPSAVVGEDQDNQTCTQQ
ncbi:hypothetical protein BASA81_008295 [Batrachochytrium salamandrivorans]|nr:hypothetical protein BASA81_008295 [Batrachochytrium salamandrivorans]